MNDPLCFDGTLVEGSRNSAEREVSMFNYVLILFHIFQLLAEKEGPQK
jgi:hypothetical protein